MTDGRAWLRTSLQLLLIATTSLAASMGSSAPTEPEKGIDACTALFAGSRLETRYGQNSQYDPALLAAGLIRPDHSSLCGPSCIANAIEKFLGGNPLIAHPERVAEIVRRYFPDEGKNVLKKGAGTRLIAKALQEALAADGIETSVEIFNPKYLAEGQSSDLELRRLEETVDDDTLVIAHIGRYEVGAIEDAGQANRKSGHYMLVAGYDSNDSRRFYFNDPNRPRVYRSALLRPARPRTFVADAYSLDFETPPVPTLKVLLEGLIVVRRHKR